MHLHATVCFVVATCVGLGHGIELQLAGHPFTPFTRWPTPPPVAKVGRSVPVERWFVQPLDHVNNIGDWQQRYYENHQFFQAGGPLFVMQAEQAASPEWLTGGQMMDLALAYHAKTYYLEHRFYGESRPTWDTTVESLQFFTPSQSIDDLAAFITSLRTDNPGSKVIAFGGSYAGNLVTWTQAKYPNLIDGAVVSSAPLLAKFDFLEFFEEVSTVMTQASPTCVSEMRNAIDTLDFILESDGGSQFLTSILNLCGPLDPNNKMDVSNVYTAFANVFANAVLNARTLTDVTDTCDLITNPLYGETPFERLVALAGLMVGTGSCFEYEYEPILEMFTNTSWANPAAVIGRRQFLFQTCTQFADFETTASPKQPFGKRFESDIFVQICKDFYDDKFDAVYVQTAVNNTNNLYGGIKPNATKAVFVHGSLDPWRRLGVITNLSGTATAIVIAGTSHCRDMATASASDPVALKTARTKIKTLVGTWIA